MQFARLSSFLFFLVSFGLFTAASPVAKELETRTAPDAAIAVIGASLLADIQADVAVLLDVYAVVDVQVDAFADIFAKIQADIVVALDAVVALDVEAYIAVDLDVVVQVYANVFLTLFPVLQEVEAAVPGVTSAYYGGLDTQLTALLNANEAVLLGFLNIFVSLTANIYVYINLNLDIFVGLYGLFGPILIILDL